MILCLSNTLTKERFISAAKVEPGSFAENMFGRIYETVTSEAMDLKKDYETYYVDEYDTFESFLFRKENLDAKDVEGIVEKLKNHPHLNVYSKSQDAYGDYTMENLVFSDGMYPMIEKIIETNFES
jgi:hypothetical protein